MFNGLKNDLQQLSSAIETRLTPQWKDPQELCRFQRASASWDLSYLAPSPQGQSGALLIISRNGKPRFTIQLFDPDSEIPQWRDALHAVLTASDQRDLGWWRRLILRLRGRRIECSRMVLQQKRPITQRSTETDRYYVARLTGWRNPCVMFVKTVAFTTGTSGSFRSTSLSLLPDECRQIADALSAPR